MKRLCESNMTIVYLSVERGISHKNGNIVIRNYRRNLVDRVIMRMLALTAKTNYYI